MKATVLVLAAMAVEERQPEGKMAGLMLHWGCIKIPVLVQAAMAAGERQPEGNLAGLMLHWGCVRHEGEGWGPPPAGWHTIPDRSFGAGDPRSPIHSIFALASQSAL